MRLDGVIPSGKTEDSLIGQNDLFAVLGDILDIEIPSGQVLDSMSFVLLIESREKYKRREHNIRHFIILQMKLLSFTILSMI